MKKLFIFVLAFASSLQFIFAQKQETGVADYTPTNLRYNFFTGLGTVRLETQEMSEAADTLVSLQHRSDDIVWSRVVYRIIDLRQKQNYRLYFPDKYSVNDTKYRNLLKVLLDALCDTIENRPGKHPLYMYNYNRIDFTPTYSDTLSIDYLVDLFTLPDPNATTDDDDNSTYDDEPAANFGEIKNSALKLSFDSTSISVNTAYFEQYSRNVVKWCIQEIYYFDKHTSRLHQQIIGIAPMYADIVDHPAYGKKDAMEALRNEIIGWIPYEQFRYYMAKQVMIPDGNSEQRVTFDDFFSQNLYSSYIIGDENMFNRVLLNYVTDTKSIKKEQERISKELLDFEQDLWEN